MTSGIQKTKGEMMRNNLVNNSAMNLESVLAQSLAPVKPRAEFIGKLRHQLEQEILPIQTRKSIGFEDIFHTLVTSLVVVLTAILIFRAILIIISTIELWRRQTRIQ